MEQGGWFNLVILCMYMYIIIPGNFFEAVSLSMDNTVTIMCGQERAEDVMALMNFSTKYSRLV